MEPEQIKALVKQAIGNVNSMTPEEIGDRADFEDDLDLDSLARVEVMVEIERTLGMEFPGNGIPEGVFNVEDVVRVVQELRA